MDVSEGLIPGFDLLCSLERQNDCASTNSVGQGVRTGSWLFHWVPHIEATPAENQKEQCWPHIHNLHRKRTLALFQLQPG